MATLVFGPSHDVTTDAPDVRRGVLDSLPQPRSEIPPGWGYNPAAWTQRLPVVGGALVGLGIAGYLALDPQRGAGAGWALPAAAFAAVCFLLTAVAGVIGGPARWRTMPWAVALFALAAGPLGAISAALLLLQAALSRGPLVLCLLLAAIPLVVVGRAMDEVAACVQHLRRQRRRGRTTWRVFLGLPPRY